MPMYRFVWLKYRSRRAFGYRIKNYLHFKRDGSDRRIEIINILKSYTAVKYWNLIIPDYELVLTCQCLMNTFSFNSIHEL